MFFGMIALAITLTVSWIGFGGARRFVRDRLRYVDAAQSPMAPLVAALGAAIIALPVVNLLAALPIVHSILWGGTWLAIGASVGLGVRAGAGDVKRGYLVSSGN